MIRRSVALVLLLGALACSSNPFAPHQPDGGNHQPDGGNLIAHQPDGGN